MFVYLVPCLQPIAAEQSSKSTLTSFLSTEVTLVTVLTQSYTFADPSGTEQHQHSLGVMFLFTCQ